MEQTSTHKRFVPALRDEALAGASEQLFRRAKDMEALLASPGWAFLEERLVARREQILKRAVHGNVLAQAEYAANLAVIQGIEEALQFPRNVLVAAEEAGAELDRIAALEKAVREEAEV